MKRTLQIFGVLIVLVVGILSVSYLQHRFDQSDLRHAVNAVRLTQAGGPEGLTLEEKLAQHYNVKVETIQWQPNLESKVQGIVTVQALIPGQAEPLVWQVDLVRFQISPQSPEAKNLFP